MTPEREAKEREKFNDWCVVETPSDLTGDIEAIDIWLARASLAAETEAENVRLREALATYGKHAVVCNLLNAFNYFGDPKNAKYIPVSERVCNCGFDAALAPKEATE